MKKYLPYMLVFLGIIISTFAWDLIKFPYDNENLINFKKEIPSNLLVTLGENGAVLVEDENVLYFDAPKVNVVDTTGAGDAFIGAFAFGLSSSESLDKSIELAVEKASLSVTKKGTQSSYLN